MCFGLGCRIRKPNSMSTSNESGRVQDSFYSISFHFDLNWSTNYITTTTTTKKYVVWIWKHSRLLFSPPSSHSTDALGRSQLCFFSATTHTHTHASIKNVLCSHIHIMFAILSLGIEWIACQWQKFCKFDGNRWARWRGDMNQFKFGTWEKYININIISNNRSIPLQCEIIKCEWMGNERASQKKNLITTWFICRCAVFFLLVDSIGGLFVCLFVCSFVFLSVVVAVFFFSFSREWKWFGLVRINCVCTTYGAPATPFSHFIQMICFNRFGSFFSALIAIDITRTPCHCLFSSIILKQCQEFEAWPA